MMAMICLPILISAVILLFRKTEKSAARYLSLFMIAAVFSMGPQIIGFAGFYHVWPGLTYFPLFYPEAWLGPLIYVHAYRLMQGGSLGWRRLLFIPGTIILAYYTWAYFGLGDYKSKWEYDNAFHVPYIIPLETVFEVGLLVFAVIAIWRMVKRYKHFVEQTSSAALEYDPVWLRNIVVAMVIAGGIYAVLEIVWVINPLGYDTAFPFQVVIMAVMAWIAIEAVWRLNLPFPKMATGTESACDTKAEPKDWAKEAQSLEQEVVTNQWYLEPRLSIRDVASRMATNETYLSRSLNKGMGQSFNQFINALRVDHAMRLIRNESRSLLTIALESGFNSKSTFNRVFRNITGQTPSQFKTSQKP